MSLKFQPFSPPWEEVIKQSVPIHPATTNLLSVPMDLSTVNLCTASPLGPTRVLAAAWSQAVPDYTVLLPSLSQVAEWLPASSCPSSPLSFTCSVAQSCLTLCDPMDCSTPDFPVLHQLLELAQTHVHPVGDAILPSHPLSPSSPPAFSLSQHQGVFQWASSLHQVAKVWEVQLQHQSSQWIFRVDFL